MPYTYPITNTLIVPNAEYGQTLALMQFAQDDSTMIQRFKQAILIVAGELSNVETIENDVLKPRVRKLVQESIINSNSLERLAKQSIAAGLTKGYILANTADSSVLNNQADGHVTDAQVLEIIKGVVNDEKLLGQLFDS